MTLEDFIRTDEYGERFIAGHRIPIQSLLWAHIEHGMDGKQLLQRFNTLSLEKIYGVLAYYYSHKDEIDKYLIETEKEIRRQEQEFRRNYDGPTRAELEKRMRAKREKETKALEAGR